VNLAFAANSTSAAARVQPASPDSVSTERPAAGDKAQEVSLFEPATC